MALAAADESNTAITLYGVMQTMIAEGLRSRYQPPQKLSHELFVLLLQLKEREPKPAAPRVPRKAQP
jgi:hypothetical protein